MYSSNYYLGAGNLAAAAQASNTMSVPFDAIIGPNKNCKEDKVGPLMVDFPSNSDRSIMNSDIVNLKSSRRNSYNKTGVSRSARKSQMAMLQRDLLNKQFNSPINH